MLLETAFCLFLKIMYSAYAVCSDGNKLLHSYAVLEGRRECRGTTVFEMPFANLRIANKICHMCSVTYD